MIRVGIFGATGYTGQELVRILSRHPEVEIAFATSEGNAGGLLTEVQPAAPPLPLIPRDEAPLAEADAVFLCLPHGASATTAVAALEAGVRVVDLSADFRLRDAQSYEQWYGTPHPAPHLLKEAVYGLTEHVGERLPGARLVANPGCYPTSVLLPLLPLQAAGAVAGTVVADSKSGVSGAGRGPKQHTHFVEVAENFSPYAIGRSHRHLPEMEQALGQEGVLLFSPHLLPVRRGILSTLYIPLAAEWDEARAREVLEARYAATPFVRVLPAGQVATLAHAVGTNRCVFGLTCPALTSSRHLIVTSAIDNLVKGAAGQAVQNLNGMFSLPETTGLE